LRVSHLKKAKNSFYLSHLFQLGKRRPGNPWRGFYHYSNVCARGGVSVRRESWVQLPIHTQEGDKEVIPHSRGGRREKKDPLLPKVSGRKKKGERPMRGFSIAKSSFMGGGGGGGGRVGGRERGSFLQVYQQTGGGEKVARRKKTHS